MSMGRTEAPKREAPRLADQSLRLARLLFGLFLTGVLVRLFLTDTLVNMLWPYTAEGGAFPVKIHPGSYLVFLSAALLFVAPGYRFAGEDLPVLRAFIVFSVGMALAGAIAMAQGRTGPAGYVIDVYLVSVAACIFLMAMPPLWRQRCMMAILYALFVNALLAMGEFASGRYIVFVEAAEFRPTGFLGAALNVGVIHLTAILLTISLPIAAVKKYAIVGVLLLGVLISASRTAMLFALATCPVAVLLTARLRQQGMSAGATAILMALFGCALLPALYLGADGLGFLDRFKGGYIDDSAQTRIEIYRVFEFVSWTDIIWGKDIVAVRRIAQEMLGIDFIESALIFFVFDFGLVGTLVFAAVLLYLLAAIARRSHPVLGLAIASFLILALTNNTLSTKVPSVFIALVMAVCSRAFFSSRR